MSDNPPPKKKSRFFDQLKWFPRSNSSKTTDRPKTPPKQSKAPAPYLIGQIPQHLHSPRLRPRLTQHHGVHQSQLSHIALPTQLEQSLSSPRTATAAAFQNLSVEDQVSKDITGRQVFVNQAQTGDAVHPRGGNGTNTTITQPTNRCLPDTYNAEVAPFYPRSTDYYRHSPTHPTALNTRKRKRATTTLLPPPAYIYTRTNDPNFNIFSALLLYPELCYHLALHLPLAGLISLYAISRDYHTILDTRFTTLMISLAEHLTPNAVRVFPFRCYAHLCRPDPAARIPHPDPRMAEQGVVRKIPSFRWLKMLLHREKVVHEIMALAAERGVPFPRRCKQVLLKFWFILDIPDNARRVGYIHNERLFGELDLYFGMCVVVRLDMLFNDPVGTEKRDGGRRMVLAQRGLTSLLLVLKGEIWKTKVEVLREWVRWKYDPREEDVRELGEDVGEGIFGVPLEECGSLKKQWWGEKRQLEGMNKRMEEKGEEGGVLWLLRPDQLIVREVVRRGLRFRKHVLRCMLYGYVDPRTLGDLDWEAEGRSTARHEQGLEGHDEYNFDDLVGGAGCVDMPDGGDRLLDLGRKPAGSRRCTVEGVGEQERKWREGEKDFARKCYAWWQQDVAEAGLGEEEMIGWESE